MARPSFMPNLSKKVETPVVETPVVETPVVETPVVETPIVKTPVVETPVEAEAKAPKEKKVKNENRKTPNKAMTPEDTQFVVANVKNMSYSEIAEARGITKHQVNRVLMQVKKQMKDAAGDNPEALATVEKYIKEQLSRPEDAFGGGGANRTSVVKKSIDDIVGNILNSLQG